MRIVSEYLFQLYELANVFAGLYCIQFSSDNLK